MRVDGKQEGLRQAMAWLHTWVGLLLGWLLFAIFLTGTLSFFHQEITTWMKPELHQSLTQQSREQQLQVALAQLQARAPDAAAWNINLPLERQTVTTVGVRAQGEDPRERRGGERLTLDSATGEVINARETAGGGFIYRFHFELYGLERSTARWIVGVATFFMLVAIISGVITHKKIFKDFFTFRPNKSQRSWLDAHNATAVFALPFHLIITFSGILLLLFTIFPWGVTEVFENRQAFLQAQNGMPMMQGSGQNGRTVLEGEARGQAPRGEQRTEMEARGRGDGESHREPSRQMNGEMRREISGRLEGGRNANRDGGAGRESGREPALEPRAQMQNLIPLWQQAQARWPDKTIASIAVTNPNRATAQVEFRPAEPDSLLAGRMGESMKFNAISGELIVANTPARTITIPAAIYSWITALHLARGVDIGLRWLLFASGLLGSLMIATGLVLWVVKRIPEQMKRGYKTRGFRFVEIANVAAIAGLHIALAGYFYANRLIGAQVEARNLQEIYVFFSVWGLCLLHAIVRSHRQAWLEQLGVAALLFASLPILNALTGGRGLFSAIYHGQWVVACFDLMVMLLAAVLAWAGWALYKAPLMRVTTRKAAAPTVAMEQAL